TNWTIFLSCVHSQILTESGPVVKKPGESHKLTCTKLTHYKYFTTICIDIPSALILIIFILQI
uniref:Uncharacterized protein n=1 Tax=Oncorhynchus mykiss TaxID=8022 RepID=A0A8K9X2L2_ONCMY